MKINFAFTCNNTVSICKDFQLNFFRVSLCGSQTIVEDTLFKLFDVLQILRGAAVTVLQSRHDSIDISEGEGMGALTNFVGAYYLSSALHWLDFFSYTKARIFIFIED